MSSGSETQSWAALETLLEQGDPPRVAEFLGSLPHGEPARLLAHLSAELRERVMTMLSAEQAADLVSALPAAQATGLVEELPSDSAAAIVEALPNHEQGDVLDSMSEESAHAILEAMEPASASVAWESASCEPSSAGRLMSTEFLAFRRSDRVEDVLDDMRANAERYSDFDVQYAYVTDDDRLVGVLRLRDLLLHRPSETIDSLMVTDPRSATIGDDLDALEQFFDELPYLGVPVVDDSGRLLGIVRRGDVESALGEKARSDHMKLAGIPGGEELRSLPMVTRSRRRLAWLSVNVFLNVAAASVIAAYQDTLSAVIALAVFLPIISDMSGCSGSQAVAVTMRELSLGLLRPQDLLHVLKKEVGLGLINGAALGMLLAGVAWLWKGNAWLGLVVGVALALNTTLAVCLGGVVPLLLKRLGRDPALASGPILTTCTDMCGFFAVLGLATALLPRLTA